MLLFNVEYNKWCNEGVLFSIFNWSNTANDAITMSFFRYFFFCFYFCGDCITKKYVRNISTFEEDLFTLDSIYWIIMNIYISFVENMKQAINDEIILYVKLALNWPMTGVVCLLVYNYNAIKWNLFFQQIIICYEMTTFLIFYPVNDDVPSCNQIVGYC